MKLNLITIFLLMSIFFSVGCKEDSITELKEESKTINAVFKTEVFPSIGDTATVFNLKLIEENDYEFDFFNYEVKIDYDNNGIYESVFSNQLEFKHTFATAGTKEIKGIVKFANTEFSFSASIIVVDVVKIFDGDRFSYFHEPHIYNSQKITVTGGYKHLGHTINMININGDYDKCAFCDYPKIYSSEMHCSQLSFDGSKIIWDSSLNLFYYDFNSGVGTAKLLYKPKYYPQGKVCWAIDNSKIFFINNDGESRNHKGVDYFDLTNNFSVTKLTDFGSYLCAVPGNSDLVAIMEKTGALSADSVELSSIKFFSVSQNKVVKEYDDIRGYNYFRIIDNGNKMFMSDPFCIYDFNKEKYYKIELKEFSHFYLDSDITYQGDKILFTIFNRTTANSPEINLYTFDLPIDTM